MPLPTDPLVDPVAEAFAQAEQPTQADIELEAAIKGLEGNQATGTPAPAQNASQGQPEGTATPSEGEPEAPADATDSERKRWVQLAKKSRAVEQREQKAREALKQAEARLAEAERKATEAAQFFDRLKKPDGFVEYLKEAGLHFDDVAQIMLGIEKPVTADDRVAKLEKQLAEREAKEAEALKKQQEAQQKAQDELVFNRDLAHVQQLIDSIGDDQFELVRKEGLYREVYKRAYDFLRANDISHVEDPNEVKLLITHFAQKVEGELEQRAKQLAEFLSQSKKLQKLGIFKHENNAPSSDGAQMRDNLEKLDPELAAIVQQAGVQDIQPSKPSKFLTNEATVAPKPVAKPSAPKTSYGTEAELEELIRLHFKS